MKNLVRGFRCFLRIFRNAFIRPITGKGDPLTWTWRDYWEAVKPAGLLVWRVRTIDCDGGKLGHVWAETFFRAEESATNHLKKVIEEKNLKNPKYPYKADSEVIDGVSGFCNWQFSTMVAMDSFEVN